MSYQYATIGEYKTAIDNLWSELATLEGELAAIVSVQDISVDLTKDLTVFLEKAEKAFADQKAAYEKDTLAKKREISNKQVEINDLLEECKRFLFDDNTIVYVHP